MPQRPHVDTDDQSVSLPGGEVFVRRWLPPGPRADEPVVLLHDSLGCVALWREFPAMLAARLGRCVIAYDRLGYGRSSVCTEPPADDFIVREAGTNLPAMLAELGVEQCALLGHSTGGGMALVAAALFDDLVTSVISIAAHAFVEPRMLDGIRDAEEAFRDPQQFARLRLVHGDRAEWVLRAWADHWLDARRGSWTLDDVLPRVRCPVLAIHGDEDAFGSVAHAEQIGRLVGGACETVVLEGGGHVPHRERRDELVDLVAEFLDGVSTA